MAENDVKLNWEQIWQIIKNILYWISVIGPVVSIIKGAVIGTIEEIKKILEEQKEKTK